MPDPFVDIHTPSHALSLARKRILDYLNDTGADPNALHTAMACIERAAQLNRLVLTNPTSTPDPWEDAKYVTFNREDARRLAGVLDVFMADHPTDTTVPWLKRLVHGMVS